MVPIKINFQASLAGRSCPWVPVFLSNKNLFCFYPNVKCFSYGRLYPGRDEGDHWIILQNLTSLLVNVQLWNTLFLWISQKESFDRTMAKLECGEKLERKPESEKKSCQAPWFCQEEASSTITWPSRRCLWGSRHQSLKWSRVCLDRPEPFIDKVYGKHQIQFLPDLPSAHYALPTRALFDELFMPYVPQEAKPSTCPQTPPSGGCFLLNPKRVGLQGKLRSPKLSTSSSSGWRSAFATWTRVRPSMSEPNQDRHPWSSRGLTLRPLGNSFLKSTGIKLFITICTHFCHFF